MLDSKQLWENTLNEVELVVSRANFTTWFKNTYVLKIDSGVVYLGVPSEFVREWLHGKYHKFMLRTMRNMSEQIRSIEYIVVAKEDQEKTKNTEETTKKPVATELPLRDLYINKEDNLNHRYTFDSFVVCPFNELAYAAAQAIVKNPGSTYNPFFIYGGTGLGKTHIIQAVGNQIKKADKEKKVYYVTSEKYYLDYITSVQSNKISVFKEKYRKYDVFIVDDIQFFSGKQGTQEELFHLFNVLSENSKQIIFSSDKHYNLIPDIEGRLRSRFGAGMLVDISEPDFESRVAILRSKAEATNFSPDEKMLEYIAANMKGSIRELEGILNTIICQAQLKNRDLSLNEVRALIKNNEKPKKIVSNDDVIKIVCEFYQIEKNLIYEKTRRKEIVKPRQVVMYLLREDFRISYPAIGTKLGGRDHTTVIHSCEKIKKDLKNDSFFIQELEQIRSMF